MGEGTFNPRLLIRFISRTHPLGAIVERVAERFVNALNGVLLSHEDLASDQLQEQDLQQAEVLFQKRWSMTADA